MAPYRRNYSSDQSTIVLLLHLTLLGTPSTLSAALTRYARRSSRPVNSSRSVHTPSERSSFMRASTSSNTRSRQNADAQRPSHHSQPQQTTNPSSPPRDTRFRRRATNRYSGQNRPRRQRRPSPQLTLTRAAAPLPAPYAPHARRTLPPSRTRASEAARDQRPRAPGPHAVPAPPPSAPTPGAMTPRCARGSPRSRTHRRTVARSPASAAAQCTRSAPRSPRASVKVGGRRA